MLIQNLGPSCLCSLLNHLDEPPKIVEPKRIVMIFIKENRNWSVGSFRFVRFSISVISCRVVIEHNHPSSFDGAPVWLIRRYRESNLRIAFLGLKCSPSNFASTLALSIVLPYDSSPPPLIIPPLIPRVHHQLSCQQRIRRACR